MALAGDIVNESGRPSAERSPGTDSESDPGSSLGQSEAVGEERTKLLLVNGVKLS